jgi:hypothetical protein
MAELIGHTAKVQDTRPLIDLHQVVRSTPDWRGSHGLEGDRSARSHR